MKRLIPCAWLAAALLLASCAGRATDESGASPSEAQALNEAAAMLDENSVSTSIANGNEAVQEAE